jgi:hypothetical protein
MLFGDGWFKLTSLFIHADFIDAGIVEGRIIQAAKKSLLRSNPACTECFPDRESSASPNNEGAGYYTIDIFTGSLFNRLARTGTVAQTSI